MGTSLVPSERISRGGRYLTFALADEHYGIDILRAQEIIGLPELTQVPASPPYLKGVFSLRGSIIPVLDLRAKFGMVAKPYDDKSCVIIVRAALSGDDVPVGCIVDRVLDVLNFAEGDLQPPPQYGACIDTSFLVAMGRANEHVVILVEIEKIIQQVESALLYALKR